MSRSFESMRWNACVHRLDLGLYSQPKEFLGNGVRTHFNCKGKIPSSGKFSSEEDRTHHAASSRTASPTHYQQAISAPKFPAFEIPPSNRRALPLQLNHLSICKQKKGTSLWNESATLSKITTDLWAGQEAHGP